MAGSAVESSDIQDYLAYRGGPFFELQEQMGQLRKDALNARRRALFYIALAWHVPLLLAVPGSLHLCPFGTSI
ncbi:hypothetical protein SAMN05892877_102156 [Rhizobium subbaraonis]|uniref:Uncharacterized protein n=1 Tax=Rhizobium subbaraonis TaxID=908946 RepID=A0A285U1I6_9HYPH|nr:hypothetical protein [Rhizobium subbaraonis]SOC35820.1 hypothetical protein SAMN05892877_102156 [Rhizobium subbaraonis]